MSEAYEIALAERHTRLEREIEAEERRPMPDAAKVLRLKKEKLRLKDELAGHRAVIPAT